MGSKYRMNIRKTSTLVEEAKRGILAINNSERTLPRTGFDCVDSHIGGLLPGDVVLFSGLSGHGKSETLYRVRKNILDKKINPEADEYMFIDLAFEMKALNILLRGVSKEMGKSKRSVLFDKFTEEELEKMNEYVNSLKDDRQFTVEEPAPPEDFYHDMCILLDSEHSRSKKGIFIAIDHMLLLEGSDKQKVIEKTIESINKLKLKFDNVYFILLSQLNRNLLQRAEDKNNKAQPNATDLFGSSFMDQISNYNIILFDAYKSGIEQYCKLNPIRYEYLKEHFGEEDSKGRYSLIAEDRIFYHVEKARESDNPYKNIFVEVKETNLDNEDLMTRARAFDKKAKEQSEISSIVNQSPPPPVFDAVEFNTLDKSSAKGEGF